MRKIIITGPTGVIGHALVSLALSEGCEVYAICRPNSSGISQLPASEKIHIIQCDLKDLKNIIVDKRDSLPKDADVFYHLGWAGTFGAVRDDLDVQIANVEYTIDAIRLAKECGCHTFVGAGSQAEYGPCDEKLSADTHAKPTTGYGMAKLCAGQMSRIEAGKLNIKHIWARVLSVYGRYDGENTMISAAIRKLKEGEETAFTEGMQLWDYLYSKDAAGIMMALGSDKSINGKVYVVGSGNARPLREYIEIIRDIVNPDADLGFGKIPYSSNQVMYLCADTADIVNDLGYEYKYGFEQGIKDLLDID